MTEIKRWTPYRKALALIAVEDGLLTAEQLQQLHQISPEELAEWRRLYELDGARALRTTRIQIYGRDLRRMTKTAQMRQGGKT